MKAKKLVLQNGKEFVGIGCGNEKVAEVVFHTGMIGYQDILKNPYYTGKIVCMTYPLMGNYGASDDDLYNQAVEIVRTDKKASISYIQRRLRIGYNRAASIIERMEDEGVVSKTDHVGRREVL